MKVFIYTYCLSVLLLLYNNSIEGRNINWDYHSNSGLSIVLHSEENYISPEQVHFIKVNRDHRSLFYPIILLKFPNPELLYNQEQSFALSQKSYRTLNRFFSYLKI